jgi:hypothetical protein
MRTTTADLNEKPKKCSAYHEAGHAVVGVARGIRLGYVTARETADLDPHCLWDRDHVNGMLANENAEVRSEFTERFAEMSLASRHSELMACRTDSDEQKDAAHCDYLGIEVMRWRARLDYFGLDRAEQLNESAKGIQTPKKSRSEQSSCTSDFRSLEAV